MVGTALPSFFLAALLMNVFCIRLGWFPLQGLTTATKIFAADAHFQIFLDKAWHMVLPSIVLILLGIGGLMRFYENEHAGSYEFGLYPYRAGKGFVRAYGCV
jgi:peptide/nickel transport system permease protein